MQTKIEGIVLSKIPYDERHIIAHLLLRSGKKTSIIFYGGRGGGKQQKSSVIELGFLLKVELRPSKSTSDFYHAKEWSLLWHHKMIRLDHNAFYLMCFLLETSQKISPIENLHDYFEIENEVIGPFMVLSNALAHLESSILDKKFYFHTHSLAFLVKTLLHLGVFPKRESCIFCHENLSQFTEMSLIIEEGGFACSLCVALKEGASLPLGRELWELLGHIAHTKYQNLGSIRSVPKALSVFLFQYFCFQFQLEEKDFKTHAMVF